MTTGRSRIEDTAAELRRAFDRSFAEPPGSPDAASTELIALRVGADSYLLRLAEIGALFVDRRISPLPSEVREFLGVAGFRGAIVPVYDLRLLLGARSDAAPRWLVIARKSPVALAFDAFDGHLRLRSEAIAVESHPVSEHVREVATSPHPRPVIHLQSVLELIERKARDIHATKER